MTRYILKIHQLPADRNSAIELLSNQLALSPELLADRLKELPATVSEDLDSNAAQELQKSLEQLSVVLEVLENKRAIEEESPEHEAAELSFDLSFHEPLPKAESSAQELEDEEPDSGLSFDEVELQPLENEEENIEVLDLSKEGDSFTDIDSSLEDLSELLDSSLETPNQDSDVDSILEEGNKPAKNLLSLNDTTIETMSVLEETTEPEKVTEESPQPPELSDQDLEGSVEKSAQLTTQATSSDGVQSNPDSGQQNETGEEQETATPDFDIEIIENDNPTIKAQGSKFGALIGFALLGLIVFLAFPLLTPDDEKTEKTAPFSQEVVQDLLSKQKQIKTVDSDKKAETKIEETGTPRSWHSKIEDEVLTGELSFETQDQNILNAELKFSAIESPKRSPEEIVNGVVRPPWIKKFNFELTETTKVHLGNISGKGKAYLQDNEGSSRAVPNVSIKLSFDERGQTLTGQWRVFLGELSNKSEKWRYVERRSSNQFGIDLKREFVATEVAQNKVEQ